MQVRPATAADAEALERIRIRGWQVAYRHVFPPAELDRLPVDWSRWTRWLSKGFEQGQTCLVAEADAILGWVTYGPSAFPDRSGEVHGLYVDPDRWSSGAGRALMAAAETALAREYDEAVLWTLEGNDRARRFYERVGWTLDGTRGTFDRLGVSAPVVRYRKELSKSMSRA
jgi:ribosomal protein S18 acetylase RimI-like enzyme